MHQKQILFFLCWFCLSACSPNPLMRHTMEKLSDLEIAYRESSCTSLKHRCGEGDYSEGETSEGILSCSCNRKK